MPTTPPSSYRLYEREEGEFAAQEFLPDATYTLFLADHGQAELALANAQRAVDVAPFVDTLDAYAWALHRNGRHEEAWEAMERALPLGHAERPLPLSRRHDPPRPRRHGRRS